VSPMRGFATGANADRLQTSRVVAHLCCPHGCRSPTTIDVPTKAQMPTLTHRLSPMGVPEPSRRGAAARLPGARNLRGATCASAVEGAARSSGGATSGELGLSSALGVWTGWSTILPRPESTTFPATGMWRSRGHGVGGQEPPRAQPRRPEHH
jgi:hypothetical protein